MVAHFGPETASSQDPYLQVAYMGDCAFVGDSTGVLMMGPTLRNAEAFQALGEVDGTGSYCTVEDLDLPLDVLVVVAQGVRVEHST